MTVTPSTNTTWLQPLAGSLTQPYLDNSWNDGHSIYGAFTTGTATSSNLSVTPTTTARYVSAADIEF